MTTFARKTLAIALLAAFAAGPAAAQQKVTKLETEKQKISYMVGMMFGQQLGSIKGEIDPAIVAQAMNTSLEGGQLLMTQEEAQTVSQEFSRKMQGKMEAERKAAGDTNKADGDKFLAANKGKPGVKTTASGLQYLVVTQGTGPKPAASDTVRVHYTGTLLDGTKFDSSVDRGEPAEFPLSGVIPGWTEGLQLMPVGSKFKFWIPSNLAYGEQGTPGPIGPNQTLAFEVELLEIVKPAAAPADK
jgi:FKBP-type peptidyl-prolyl cis-trans isomerase FkpA